MGRSALLTFALLFATIPACEGKLLYGGSTGDASAPPDASAPAVDTPPVVVLAENQSPLLLALDDANIYWSNRDTGVNRLSKAGGAVTQIAALPSGSAYTGASLPIDDGSLYTLETPASGFEAVFGIPLSGGTRKGVALGIEPNFTVAGGQLYSAYVRPVNKKFPWSLWIKRQPVAGGSGADLAVPASLDRKVAPSGATLAAAVAGRDAIYMSFQPNLGILQVPMDGGAIAHFDVGDAWGIAVDDTSVYFTVSTGRSIFGITKPVGTPFLIASTEGIVGAPVVDDRFVYFLSLLPTATLSRVPKQGGTPTVLAATALPDLGVLFPLALLAVDDAAVYSICGSSICKLAK